MPFRIDDRTPVEVRLAWLERILSERNNPLFARLVRLADAYAGPVASEAVRAQAALRFAQRAGYIADPPGEWFQPIDWTIRYGGDCEDLASLFVALARAMGVRARICWIDIPAAEFNHVSAQVWLDGRWQWAEASVCGAHLGEAPMDAARRLDAWYIFRPGAGYVSCPPSSK